MARCHVRCRKCQARRVLKRHPETYFKWSAKELAHVNRAPACNNCGAQDYRVDTWMNQRNTRAMSCSCNGYVVLTHKAPWPHRIGSPYCSYRKDGTQRMPGDNDFKDLLFEQMSPEEQQLIFNDERIAA
jgi:hypothetical protein